MEWIVKIEKNTDIENERDQRVRITFNPILELVHFFAECKTKNNQWTVFSQDSHKMEITLEQLKEKMEKVVMEMRKRLVEYENLNKGFTVLKLVAFETED